MSEVKVPETSRWQCPSCGSPSVQISLPNWFYETKTYDLISVEPDAEADVLWWCCDECGDTGSGQPDEAI